MHIQSDPSVKKKPLIAMHGLLGSKTNLKGICNMPGIKDKRDVYLVEMRNHAHSDHHKEHTYALLADDVIRFADQQQIDRFDVLGHSMGGRTACEMVARYPDRVDGCISIDAAPVDETNNPHFGSFVQSVVSLENHPLA